MSTGLLAEDAPSVPTRGSVFRMRPRLGVSAALGVTIVGAAVAAALIGPLVYRVSPLALGASQLAPPSLTYPMGTDNLGRDILARFIYGARVSLAVGTLSALVAVGIGSFVGGLAGYLGGRADFFLMRVTEVFQVVPLFLLAIIIVALFGSGQANVILVIGILSWPATARIARGQVLVLREEEYILAAKLSGATWARILTKHMLPNVVPYLVVSASLQTGSAILVAAFLGFLGLGDPSQPSWGLLLNQGQLYLTSAWWLPVFPGLGLSLTILGLNLLGDGIGATLSQRQGTR